MLRSPVKPGTGFCLEQLKNNSISIRAISKLKWYYHFFNVTPKTIQHVRPYITGTTAHVINLPLRRLYISKKSFTLGL